MSRAVCVVYISDDGYDVTMMNGAEPERVAAAVLSFCRSQGGSIAEALHLASQTVVLETCDVSPPIILEGNNG